MDAVVKVIRGSKLSPKGKTCVFCDREATACVCSVDSESYDGTVLKIFPLCNDHTATIDQIISGEIDVDRLCRKQRDLNISPVIKFRD